MGGRQTFSEKVVVLEPIFSLCVMIFAPSEGGLSSKGRSNCLNVKGGGDSVGGFSRLEFCKKIVRNYVKCLEEHNILVTQKSTQ